MRIFSESPLDRRDHTNRLSCHIIHEFRFSRIDFCSAARCRQRAGESGSYDLPRAFTGISRVHSTATVAHRALTRRIILHANLRLQRVGFRAAARRRQCAGKSGSFRRVAVQRDPRLLVLALQRLEHAHRHEQPHDVGGIRLRVEALKRVRIRLRKEACGRKRLLRPAPRLHGNLPRPLDRHGRANRALARRVTRIFVSRASAFARLHAAANAPESAVGRKRAAPACGRKRLLRPAPRLHGNLPRPLDRHGCANRALARRIMRIFVSRVSAFARLRKVPACGQKRLLRPSR